MRTFSSLARQVSFQVLSTLVMLAVPLSSPAVANQPKVDFDLGYVVECHDVTPQAFALLHPDEKVVEANLRVSVRMDKGDEKDVEQMQFEITSPGGRLRVIDFLPRTQVQPEAADSIEVVKTSETIRSLGATIGTTLAISSGFNQSQGGATFTSAMPAGNANATHRNELKETTKKIPQGKAVIASGTLANEHGLFFKLRRTPAGTFEGIKPFSFRFVVPSDWRGDWLVLSCEARGMVKRYFFKSSEVIGARKAFLALHLAGDAVAERVAFDLASAEEQYLATKPVKERFELIDVLANEAQPWHSPADARGVEVVTCMKPVTSGIFKFAISEKSDSSAPCQRVKKSLDRLARFSAASTQRPRTISIDEN